MPANLQFYSNTSLLPHNALTFFFIDTDFLEQFFNRVPNIIREVAQTGPIGVATLIILLLFLIVVGFFWKASVKAKFGITCVLITSFLGAGYLFLKEKQDTRNDEKQNPAVAQKREQRNSESIPGTFVEDSASQAVPETAFIAVQDFPIDMLKRNFGQLFLVGFDGFWDSPNDKNVIRELIRTHKVGGVLLFRRNIPLYEDKKATTDERREGIIDLIDRIQKEASREIGQPLLIAVDQEGGNTAVLAKGIVTEMPSPMAIGSLRDESAAYQAGLLIGKELDVLGINMNLAPVADVNTNSDNDLIRDRSFGGHHDMVAPLAKAFFYGQRDAGILSVAKHFPGHGNTEEGIENPGVPDSSHTIESLNNSLEPFRQLAGEGIEAMMTSHFRMSKYNKNPVTFDRQLIKDLLRGSKIVHTQMGTDLIPVNFKGVLIADDLCLPAITAEKDEPNFGIYSQQVSQAVIKAFDAGHDLLILAHVFPDSTKRRALLGKKQLWRKHLKMSEFDQVYNSLKRHIFEDGTDRQREMRIQRLKDSLKKIFRLKTRIRRSVNKTRNVEKYKEVVFKNKHHEIARKMFEDSFELIEAEKGFPFVNVLDQEDKAIIFFPTRFKSYQDIEKIKKTDPKRYMANLEAHDFPSELKRRLEERTNLKFVMDLEYPSEEGFPERAREISQIIQQENPNVVFFLIGNSNQWQLFNHTAVQLSHIKGFRLNRVIVVVTAHPNLLSYQTSRLSKLMGKINFLIAYSGFHKRAAILSELLAKGIRPGLKSELGVPISKIHPNPSWTVKRREI